MQHPAEDNSPPDLVRRGYPSLAEHQKNRRESGEKSTETAAPKKRIFPAGHQRGGRHGSARHRGQRRPAKSRQKHGIKGNHTRTPARMREGGRRSSLARSDAQRGRKTAPPITTNGGTQAGTESARSPPDLMNRHRPQRAAPGGEGRAKSLREAKPETVTQSHRNFR